MSLSVRVKGNWVSVGGKPDSGSSNIKIKYENRKRLQSVFPSPWDLGVEIDMTGVVAIDSMFEYWNVNGSPNIDTSRVTSMFGMFRFSMYDYLNLNSLDTGSLTSLSNFLANSGNVNSHIDMSGLDTSKVKSIDYMFSGCSAYSIDISGCKLTQSTGRYGVFQDARYLRELYVLDEVTADMLINTANFPNLPSNRVEVYIGKKGGSGTYLYKVVNG